MAVSEELRLELYEALKETIGGRQATTMMALVPPVDWGGLSTKRDLEQLATELRSDFAQLRGEFVGLRGDVHGEIGDLRAELHRELGQVHAAMAGMHRNLFFGMLASQAAFAGLLAGLIVAVS